MSRRRYYIAAVIKTAWTWIWLAALGFGIGFPLMKTMFESGMDVWQILVPRYIAGTALIWGVLLARSNGRAGGRARRQGAVLGVVNVAAPTILMSVGTDLLPASVAGVLTALIPMATVAAAHLLVPGERFTLRRVPGLLLATAGVVILVAGPAPADSTVGVLGVGVFLTGVLMAGVGGALNRRFAMQTPAMSLVLAQFLAASLAVALIGIPLGGAELSGLAADQWARLALLSTVGTALPFFALLKASEIASAAKASLVGYIVPLLAAAISIAALGDPVSLPFLIGGGLILAGVVTADQAERRIPSLV